MPASTASLPAPWRGRWVRSVTKISRKTYAAKTSESRITTLLVEEKMKTLPTPEEALKALKAQPGIDISQQPKGSKIIVETDGHLFEITVLSPVNRLVEVS